MKKKDLQDFDIVITREHKSYFVYKDCIISITEHVVNSLDLIMYDDNLLRRDKIKAYDIVQVLRYDSISTVSNLSVFMNHVLNQHSSIQYAIIFEREEFTEVTMDEIAKKFGIPVEQLKIKK